MKNECCGKLLQQIHLPHETQKLGYQEWMCTGTCGRKFKQRIRVPNKMSEITFRKKVAEKATDGSMSDFNFRIFVNNLLSNVST